MKILKDLLFKILEFSYHFSKLYEIIFYKNKKLSIRVLIYHDIKTEIQQKLFENQIKILKKEFEFISPDEFENFYSTPPSKGKYILLTFDDGFKSNRKIAEETLKKYNIKALFFIVSDFIGQKFNSSKYNLIINNIYPNGPSENELSEPMDVNDIEFLLSNGHQIGCHTFSHQMLSKLNSKEELEKELIKSKFDIESKFKIKIKHFAFPFGTIQSIDKDSIEILNNNYSFIHSGFRGNNLSFQQNKIIFRDAVNPELKIQRLKAFLIGNADLLYFKRYKKIKKYID